MQIRQAIRLGLGATVAAALAGSIGASAAAAPSAPAQGKIDKAVRAAERSPSLWATINICNTARYPHELGIRGQMPALSFPSNLYMIVQVKYRPRPGSRFRLDPGTEKHLYLGHTAKFLRQAGVTFMFKQPAVFAGRITFVWKLNGRTIGQVTRATTAHHKHVDYADPSGHSSAVCVMK